MTQQKFSVTGKRDASRARPRRLKPYVTAVTPVTHDSGWRDVTHGARDVHGAPLRCDPVTITVQPWPNYTEDGEGPWWPVRIEAPKFSGWLSYSSRLRRFSGGKNLMRVRRGSPKVFREALRTVEATFLPEAERSAT